MPTVDPDDLAVIRSWCGSDIGTPDSLHPTRDLSEKLARLASPEEVALEILRQQRADYLASPTKVDYTGDYSHDTSENLKVLDARISQLERITGASGSQVTVSRMVRGCR